MREPTPRDRRYRTSVGAPVDLTGEVERLSEVYPLKRGGRAVPDPSRPPRIGPACETTGLQSRPGKRFASTDELRSGVEGIGTRGNNEVQKTAQEYGNAVTERFHGQPTMPARPGDRT